MRESLIRNIDFTEYDVRNWCANNKDSNPIHTDEEYAENSTFGERVVPGMMLLDKVSGMLTNLGEDGEEIILAGITAARFRDPVYLGEEVTYTVNVVDEDNKFVYVDFETHVEERDSLVAHGTISLVVN